MTTTAITSKTKAWKCGWNDTVNSLLGCTEKISEYIANMRSRIVVAQANSSFAKVAWQYAEGAKDAIDTWESSEIPPDFVDNS